ncbi:MAG: hypothetical protein GY906_35450 [bacterium]|nr:hypothetical protein [bacterium]
MEANGRDYYLNLDFDLSLRPHWKAPSSGEMSKLIAEMGLHCWLVGAKRQDCVRSVAEPEADLLPHLEHHGIEAPTIGRLAEIRPDADFVPMGWSGEAAQLNQRLHAPREHPDLEVVRRVNGRRFSLSLERELFGADSDYQEFDNIDDLAQAISLRRRPAGWIVKGEFGNAGLASRRVREAELSDADHRVVVKLILDCGTVVVEPWLQRTCDLCCTYNVDHSGAMREFNVHEVVNTADGAFIGALFDRQNPVILAWRDELRDAASSVSLRLSKAGYFGPVCHDALVYLDDRHELLRPLVDLNARSHVSAGILRQWRLWDQTGAVYWRSFQRSRLDLPNSLAGVIRALGENAYHRRAENGILPTTGLTYLFGDRKLEVRRFGVLFRHHSRAGVFELERRFRGQFER